jgi:hypothetical protein
MTQASPRRDSIKAKPPMATRFTEALSLSIPIDMRARLMRCVGAWICLYAFLTVGSVVTSL